MTRNRREYDIRRRVKLFRPVYQACVQFQNSLQRYLVLKGLTSGRPLTGVLR